MLEQSFCQLKGISGTGKGTRTWQLISFLETKYRSEIISMRIDRVDDETGEVTTGKPFILGNYLPDINVLSLGKFVKSQKSGLINWNSLDYMRGCITADRELLDMLGKINHYNIIVEGYPVTISGSYELPNLGPRLGYHNYYLHYFLYRTFEDLQARIVQRSGKEIKGTCWAIQTQAIKEIKKHVNFIEEGSMNLNVKMLTSFFDEDHTEFGCSYMDFVGIDIPHEEYKDHASRNPVLRDTSHIKENLAAFGDKLELYNMTQKKLRREEIPVTIVQTVVDKKG